MKTKRFSVLQLILAVLLTAVVLTGGGLLALRAVVGQGGLALLEGLFLVHTRFVGDYDTAAVVDAALEGMVDGLGDRWSYYLTAEEYEAQNQRRKNQYVGIGVTVNYEREEGLLILEVTEGSPAAQAGLLAGSAGRRGAPSRWRCALRPVRRARWRCVGPPWTATRWSMNCWRGRWAM